jgi:hypothetical protein
VQWYSALTHATDQYVQKHLESARRSLVHADHQHFEPSSDVTHEDCHEDSDPLGELMHEDHYEDFEPLGEPTCEGRPSGTPPLSRPSEYLRSRCPLCFGAVTHDPASMYDLLPFLIWNADK